MPGLGVLAKMVAAVMASPSRLGDVSVSESHRPVTDTKPTDRPSSIVHWTEIELGRPPSPRRRSSASYTTETGTVRKPRKRARPPCTGGALSR